YHTGTKGAQEAHEAIRPTYVDIEQIHGSEREQKLYTLIRRRAIASQMADATLERTTAEIQISNRPEHLTAQGETIKFDGFLRVYMESHDDETAEAAGLLPALTTGEKLNAIEITATQRFTAHPPRYTEASLVKKMEELGIGRPSTYAPTISTIQQRQYVERGDKDGIERQFEILSLNPLNGSISSTIRTETVGSDRGKLVPTDTGMIVNDYLAENFPDILDYNFTAQVEEQFDEIAEGKSLWQSEIGKFYNRFHPEVDRALATRTEHRVGERILGTDPKSGKPVSVKIGRFGPLVQIGDAESDEKPRFASLLKGQSMASITLDEALGLFEFPRIIGDFEGSEVSVAIGRFGPYVKHAGKFASIPKDIEPAEITLQQAIDLIVDKRREEAGRILRDFPEEPELQILNGRFGPYIVFRKKNYKIPRTVEKPETLTLEQCHEIIQNQPAPKAGKTRSKKS
ncbi:MAG: DNA topoisomerase I, partial [Muribaculaceae bacterium]|nr:DNA topoisomerase I [Muribaculaceae bacterium]